MMATNKSNDDLHSSLNQALRDFAEFGVAKIPNVFSKEDCYTIRAAALYGLRNSSPDQPYSSGRHLQDVMIGDIPSPALLFWPTVAIPQIDRLRCSDRMKAVASSFLGNNIRQLNNQIYFRLPGDGDSFAWHQDIMFRRPRPNDPHKYIQSIVAIDPMNSQNGGVQFVLGSHTIGELDLHRDSRKDLRDFTAVPLHSSLCDLEIKVFDLEPGDMLVWGLHTVHGSTSNSRMPCA